MPQHADVPLETDILCEHCGYGLNGLPTDGLCPECGKPIADSTVGDGRLPPPWEAGTGSTRSRFMQTTRQIIFSPATFFRRLNTRTDRDLSRAFVNRQHWLSALVLGVTATIHADATRQLEFITYHRNVLIDAGIAVIFVVLVRIMLGLITKLASTLTRLEGGFWGYRMPATTVRRAMNFHSAQLLPVSLLGFFTVAIFRVLMVFNIDTHIARASEYYLFVVCVEVLLGAGYLFRTYWIAMKNIMYANR